MQDLFANQIAELLLLADLQFSCNDLCCET